MITEDQTAVIDFLASPSTHGGASVERIETHTAIVFLAGTRAYKLKRAVQFDYLDFSTPERRRALCDEEVRLNRRTAPALYRGVMAVTRERDGRFALGGSGTPVDWVVEMTRFDQEALFDRLAAAGHLEVELMPPLAAAIAELHTAAERRADHGGKTGMAWVIKGNAAGFAAGKGHLLGDQRRRAATLLQHQEGIGGLHADVQDRAVRVRAQPVNVRQRGCATMPADPRQREPLLSEHARVRALNVPLRGLVGFPRTASAMLELDTLLVATSAL